MAKVLRYLGLVKEETYNQKPVPVARMHVDIASASLDSPADTDITYTGGLGRAASKHRPGFYSPEGDFNYAWDINTITYLFYFTLGGYTFTDKVSLGEALNTHEIYGVDDALLPSFAAFVGKDLFEHVFSGCVAQSLTLDVEGEFCEATMSINAAEDDESTLKDISQLSLPDQYPLAFHEVTIKKDGIDISEKVKKLNLSIDNGLSVEAGRTVGSRHPRRIIAGERGTTLGVDLYYDTLDETRAYWGNDEFTLEINFNSGALGSMTLFFPRVKYTSVPQQVSGTDEIVQGSAIKAYTGEVVLEDGTTVVSEVVATINNTEGGM